MTRPTIVVVAAEGDGEARALAARLPHLDVQLLTPGDLSCPGWEFRPGSSIGTAVAGGLTICAEDIAAVLVRLPWVREHDLYRIDPADRSYVAAEMSAFLLAWLSAMPCPVLNRPTTSCLAGPLWRQQRWTIAAAVVGLPVAPLRFVAPADDDRRFPVVDEPAVTATVVGDRCLGIEDPVLAARLGDLARLAGAGVLTVGLSHAGKDACFVAASPWPDLTDDAVLDAVLELAGVSARGMLAGA